VHRAQASMFANRRSTYCMVGISYSKTQTRTIRQQRQTAATICNAARAALALSTSI
jgi:hypothetical protein